MKIGFPFSHGDRLLLLKEISYRYSETFSKLRALCFELQNILTALAHPGSSFAVVLCFRFSQSRHHAPQSQRVSSGNRP
jgi:hypothetical protein